jgi:type II secretory pathway pseudopilin PulG
MMYVHSIVSANISRMRVFRNIITAVLIVVFLLALAWGALFIRARIIRKRRRLERERQRRQRRRQAERRRAQGGGQPPQNPK